MKIIKAPRSTLGTRAFADAYDAACGFCLYHTQAIQARTRRTPMGSDSGGYILTEIWNARPSWLALSQEDRQQFFHEKIGPLIMSLLEQGAEFLGCATNDNTGPERIDYRYMAVWKLPDKAFSDRLESGAKEASFLDYFEQVNFSGRIIPPDVLNADMIQLDG